MSIRINTVGLINVSSVIPRDKIFDDSDVRGTHEGGTEFRNKMKTFFYWPSTYTLNKHCRVDYSMSIALRTKLSDGNKQRFSESVQLSNFLFLFNAQLNYEYSDLHLFRRRTLPAS